MDSYNMFSLFSVSEKDNKRVLNFVLGDRVPFKFNAHN